MTEAFQKQIEQEARQAGKGTLAVFAARRQFPGVSVHVPYTAIAQIRNIQGPAVRAQGQAGCPGHAADHPLHRPVRRVIHIHPAGAGVGQQLGAQGRF